ncbi:C39 family peptidase [Deinococcus soli (ex Cha et al. 2016)]|uniref:Double-glycine peptidase n=2 Tax=Deinococcus soli (ex Cha et al. 2016) TaxID=1309411 RepID=A0ACC6KFZ7_9DEIO|nr:C39 family peptidase [Deinococcus soli (ex Cha et al. 2016)]MDR6218464.1 putative double-glycine peptidase [Deinococcus soli (ex Cha et al. 2016)]MDR6329204.1 putative double-glycine peptidase [Deinococcus soli (ex Cha et al. 2016)]MDR6751477.1 putative double-glycine peptidase [Deinococcus soli (ex Cha et al. 2016)]
MIRALALTVAVTFAAGALAAPASTAVKATPATQRTSGGGTATTPIPPAAYLQSVGWVKQTYNNCGPASIIAALENYGLTANQAAVARQLRPNGGYMTADVIDPFLRSYGLSAQRYKNGSIQALRPLIASGIPVIVLQWLDREGGIPHFRVVRGYDDRTQTIYLSDSIYGPNVYLSYTDFERLWGVYRNEMIPVFPTGMTDWVNELVAGG